MPPNDPQDLTQLYLMLGRIEGKMDGLLRTRDDQQEQIDSHDQRIAKLEHQRSWIVGAGAAIGFALGFFKDLFWK